ncbi:MAG: RnfABCDGE type electron transport complex subunit B [Treponema sp.]|jgi:Na+-translocating ferredoxin:NAD+ oxidoreductase RNF subunit RnfB|nr:RnfABCDGE type electron transport complex subunit B [Treponema sp.]
MNIILLTALFAATISFILGITLGFFQQLFYVPDDPLVAEIRDALPGANCGACGYPGCGQFAAAVAGKEAPLNACTVGGQATVDKLAQITGGEAGEFVEKVAVLACQGSSAKAPEKGNYTGLKTCDGAKNMGGTKLCLWGCYGFGDCFKVCTFDAITMNDGLPVVDYSKCTGCGVCAKECPQTLFQLVARNQKGAIALCSNKNTVKTQVAKTCKISCFKCNLCVKNCQTDCINMETHIPVVDISKCNSCGICAEKCPTKVFKVIERDLFK